MLHKIISGGQTGADQAGLDAAIDTGVEHGGWIPRGRRTEAGRLPLRYHLQETRDANYPRRTEKNILSADGTVVFTKGRPDGGSALTLKLARQHGRPVLHVNLIRHDRQSAASLIFDWLTENKIKVLNVAGCRESKAPGIYKAVYGIVRLVIEAVKGETSLGLFAPQALSSQDQSETGGFNHKGRS